MLFVLNGGGLCGGGVTPKHRAGNLALNYELTDRTSAHLQNPNKYHTHVKKTKHFDKQS